jgi:hypothetical protein
VAVAILNDSTSDLYRTRNSARQRNQHLLWLRHLRSTAAAAHTANWSKLMKREVVVEVYVEMLLKENN